MIELNIKFLVKAKCIVNIHFGNFIDSIAEKEVKGVSNQRSRDIRKSVSDTKSHDEKKIQNNTVSILVNQI
jgi:hypothetical protein